MNRLKSIPRQWIAAVVIVAVAIAAITISYNVWQALRYDKVTAHFTGATGLYPGDDVRVLGVKVGKVDDISPGEDSTTVTMSLDSNVDIPADARAVIIAQSLVSGRFVQLAPVYTDGPTLSDGDEIPLERTAVPVEWDEIKTELTKLSTELGPQGDAEQGSLGNFVDAAANNLAGGNAESLNAALTELSHTIGLFGDKRDDLFGTVRNLQIFVSALANSNEQIVQFGGRLASVSEVLSSSSDELGQALNDLDVAIVDVQRFINDNDERLTTGVDQLGQATKVLADKRPELEQVLHIAPNALANFYNIYMPATGSLVGVIGLNEIANPAALLCGAIEGTETNDSQRTADLCRQFLMPIFQSIIVNYPPILTNVASNVGAFPDQIVYQPPNVVNEVSPETRAATTPPLTTPASGATNLGSLMLPGGGR
ncbi:MCE family protein [Aldersonia sp. NBC_00410]|uniref:MCE family protein n=1 Tax=Aldersonia sp. NBC_00410 TaxID=2975954 RepID=UPI0022505811|nr:MCE family protein [Aldersonia sp. NBC_00410]MCX5043360.1 MCE family protein [Aldersonia sp. NBC_00410]